jgi:hypothetical protein
VPGDGAGTHSGNNDGCTLSPPYFAPCNIRDGTKSPKDTATIKFIPSGGYRTISISLSNLSQLDGDAAWISTYLPFSEGASLMYIQSQFFC